MNQPILALVWTCLAWGTVATSASAQQRIRLSGGPTLAQMRVHSETDTVSETLSAAEMGFEGTVAFRRLALRIRYAQANLSPSDAIALPRETVEGNLALTVDVLRWLRIGTGVRRRTYDTEPYRQRWIMWDAIAAAELPIFQEAVTGSAELRGALAGSLDARGVTEGWGRGFAGEVGMRVAPPRIPVWLRFGYRLEMQRLAGNVRRDVVDGLTVLVGVGAR